MKILLIDNYDSFTYNLVQYLEELDADVEVVLNDQILIDEIKEKSPDKIVISPGPCTPNEAGISVEVIQKFYKTIPILGVCLGHQAIAAAFGAKIIRAPQIMHGKTSEIHHDNFGVYTDLPNPFVATRYHSLIIDKESLSEDFTVTAWTKDQVIMGIRHKSFPLEGVQFHPESILTTQGKNLLRNFLK